MWLCSYCLLRYVCSVVIIVTTELKLGCDAVTADYYERNIVHYSDQDCCVVGRDRGDNTEVGQVLEDTVFIQNLPETITEELLAKHFAAVGTVKVSNSLY